MQTLIEVFAWSCVINLSLLTLWFLLFIYKKDLIFSLHSKVFSLPRSHFDSLHYGGMGLLKIFIIFFNISPYLALRYFT